MPSLSRSVFLWVAALMVLLAVTVRIHNVIVFPALRAPDAFGHFTYIWYLAETGRVPLPTSGWSFFHPPLYYAVMVGFWRVLAELDPVTRLKIGTGFIALLGLTHAGVAFAFVRRRFPKNHMLQLAAPGFVLFLPVHLYSAGYLGNEALAAVLCSVSLFATLKVLDRPVWPRAVVLGFVLGLAMLTKFTAIGIVAGACATIGLRSLLRREIVNGAFLLVVTSAVMLSVCGWFYLRNIEMYGNPFQMSRDTLAVRRVENLQTQGERGILEYVLFDPMILVRPQWPRGYPLQGPLPAGMPHSALRESVWTGMFANTFFDAVGGQLIPAVTRSEASRRSGQILLTLAVVPTALVLLGLITTLQGLWRSGWSDIDALMVFCFLATIAIFVYGTRSVPMHAAVKASYLFPATAMFGYWFVRGLDRLGRASPRAGMFAVVDSVLLVVASVAVFTLGCFVGKGFLEETPTSQVFQNAYGLIAYAGGDRERTRELFEASALGNWHLGQENLAAINLENGQPLEALYRLRLASSLQTSQSFGLPQDRAQFDRTTQAEYRNSMAVLYYDLGWMDAATAAIRVSIDLDGSIPETHYDDGVVRLTKSLSTDDPAGRRRLLERGAAAFGEALALDPAFHQAWTMKAVVAARSGQCADARAARETAEMVRANGVRSYPVETGPGDWHAAGLHRRRHIDRLPAPLRFDVALAACEAAGKESEGTISETRRRPAIPGGLPGSVP